MSRVAVLLSLSPDLVGDNTDTRSTTLLVCRNKQKCETLSMRRCVLVELERRAWVPVEARVDSYVVAGKSHEEQDCDVFACGGDGYVCVRFFNFTNANRRAYLLRDNSRGLALYILHYPLQLYTCGEHVK